VRGDGSQPVPSGGVLAGGKLGKARTGTIRTTLINIPARLAFSAGSYTLHLPANSRRERPFMTMFDNVQAPATPQSAATPSRSTTGFQDQLPVTR